MPAWQQQTASGRSRHPGAGVRPTAGDARSSARTRPTPTTERIARAALEILGEAGPAELTMRAVRARLDVSPRALYNYAADRRDPPGEIVALCQRDRPQPPAGRRPPTGEPADLLPGAACLVPRAPGNAGARPRRGPDPVRVR
ncbi:MULTISPECIES: TetR/AcrR family transcriptional regulator [unclassified Streptomyces]|uniref:TetR/AcrR family transcriptional regulator n=1 Tax=Streptomyces sp. NPDC127532 TaxID=3345399 RepID=UPI003633C12C